MNIPKNTGFIKLYRSFLEWEWYTDGNTMRLFLHCILKANYHDRRWQGIDIPKGSFVTSTRALTRELKLTHQITRTSLSKLENSGEINTRATQQNTIIEVVNYAKYQGFNSLNVKNSEDENKKQHTDNTRANTQVNTY